MNDKAVAKLIKRISKGSISKGAAIRELNSIERKYGSLDMLYDISDRTDSDYYEELLTDYRMGVYSRTSILKMIEIRSLQKKLPVISYSTIMKIVVGVIVLSFVSVMVIWRIG